MILGKDWVPLDKCLDQYFVKIKGSYSEIEAMYSYTLDIDNGKSVSIAGYAMQWGWSRSKVRRFLAGIKSVKGHIKDSKRTQKGQAIHFIDKALLGIKDSKRTVKGHKKDRLDKHFAPEIYSFVDDFSKYISEANPSLKKDNREKAADIVDKLIRLDGYTLDYIRKVLKWAVKDDFWSGNIFSLVPLRSKSANTLSKFQNIENAFKKKPIDKTQSTQSGVSKQNASKQNKYFDDLEREKTEINNRLPELRKLSTQELKDLSCNGDAGAFNILRERGVAI